MLASEDVANKNDNDNKVDMMWQSTRRMLEQFYFNFNKKLVTMTGNINFLWEPTKYSPYFEKLKKQLQTEMQPWTYN